MNKAAKLMLALAMPFGMLAQSSKVQTAFRNLEDYNNSKDVSSLLKAKEAIDMASNNEDTREKAKTWVYRAKVYYALFQNNLEQEEKKFADVKDKNEKRAKAYGNVSTGDYQEAGKALEKAVSLDKEQTYKQDYAILGMQMMGDVNNLAVGKYNAGKYLEAADYFRASYETTKMMGGKKDTNTIINALVCAQKAKDNEKIKEYNEYIIKEKVATAYNYNSLYETKLAMKDTVGAVQVLKEGRAAFPNDASLMNREIESYLQKGKDAEALTNLDKAIALTPNNGLLYLVRGNIYDKQANPKEGGKEKEKPKNFDELMGKAEENYKRAAELDPKNSDAWYNLGALYNNWGGVAQKRCDDLIKQATKMKECEAQANDKFNKAIPPLEKSLELHPGDRSVMVPLRKLYLLTNQNDKAQKMSEELKSAK